MPTQQILKLDDPQNETCIAQATTWREAVNALVAFWVSLNRCFSSGEVATAIRTFRMHDLRFAVTGLGRYLREEWEAQPQRLPPYATGPVVRVERWLDNGQMVYVYGPTFEDAEDHDFECSVPKPPILGQPVAPVSTVVDPSIPAGVVKPLEITGKDPDLAETLFGEVYRNGRVTVPRRAFERAVQMGSPVLTSGTTIKVENMTDQSILWINPPAGEETHAISVRGRVEYKPTADTLAKGDRCPLICYADRIVVCYR